MTRIPISKDISGRLVFLGTGTSHGIPMIGCGCPTCTHANDKNRRTRCAVVLGLPDGNLLIDTPPDLRIQLVREGIGLVHSLLYTHAHADHLFGLDDVRVFPRYLGHNLPVYCEEHVEETIRRAFHYIFDPAVQGYPAGGIPKLSFRRVSCEPFDVLGATAVPVRLLHGRHDCLGFRFGNVAYCTDTKQIPPESMSLLGGLDVLILDCLRHTPHVTHMGMDEALEVVGRLAPKRAIFTHMSHDLEHEATSRALPDRVELAYDGLQVPLGVL